MAVRASTKLKARRKKARRKQGRKAEEVEQEKTQRAEQNGKAYYTIQFKERPLPVQATVAFVAL